MTTDQSYRQILTAFLSARYGAGGTLHLVTSDDRATLRAAYGAEFDAWLAPQLDPSLPAWVEP